MTKRIAFPFVVIFLAVVALTAIWYSDAFATIYEFIANFFDWIL